MMVKNKSIGRGTEPPLELKLPEGSELTDYEFIRFTLMQGNIIAVKEYSGGQDDDIYEAEDGKIYIRITQEETLRLDERLCAKYQLRFKPAGGKVETTPACEFSVRELLGREDIIG